MKYFTIELLDKLQYPNSPTYPDAEKKWNENIKLYQKEYEKSKKLLDDSFNDFIKQHSLHDAHIVNVDFHQKKDCLDLSITLRCRSFTGTIVHHDVSFFNLTNTGALGDYIYDELLVSKGKLIHNILTSNYNEYAICCKQIYWNDL